MIAIDSSSFIAYLEGDRGPDVEATGLALEHRQAVLPPVVLSELLSDPQLAPAVKNLFESLPLLDLLDGYWQRAGLLRARLIAGGRRARLADTRWSRSRASTTTCPSSLGIGTFDTSPARSGSGCSLRPVAVRHAADPALP